MTTVKSLTSQAVNIPRTTITPGTTTGEMPTIPSYATLSKIHADRLVLCPPPTVASRIEAALRSILLEVTPGQRPHSTDSYLPAHLVQAAQTALSQHESAAHQHAHNALSTAAWHIARGEAPQALARVRRAQSHIMASMEVSA